MAVGAPSSIWAGKENVRAKHANMGARRCLAWGRFLSSALARRMDRAFRIAITKMKRKKTISAANQHGLRTENSLGLMLFTIWGDHEARGYTFPSGLSPFHGWAFTQLFGGWPLRIGIADRRTPVCTGFRHQLSAKLRDILGLVDCRSVWRQENSIRGKAARPWLIGFQRFSVAMK